MPRSRSLSPAMKKVFDANYAKKMAKGYDLKVTLKKNFKGYSLFAKKPIKKGNVIAYYTFLLHKYTDDFQGKKGDMYVMSVYNKSGRFNSNVIGDVFEGSLRKPKHNIPYWAYFSNEPSRKQKENAFLDVDPKGNFKNRSRVKAGETMTYKLIALKNIPPGEEITWCYGDTYDRDYKANCDE